LDWENVQIITFIKKKKKKKKKNKKYKIYKKKKKKHKANLTIVDSKNSMKTSKMKAHFNICHGQW